ncbi:MAG TPA: DUF2383 domain-containing protein [Gemmatimonadaceae bacterium]|nr:DUF2383 domain-containing protein [Gemmatimonadaceae bacterium]
MEDEAAGLPVEGQPALVAELNDLLRLNHDALQAYALAISALESDTYRAAVEHFQSDHERHVGELARLVRQYGGTPAELPHASTGAFKLAVQGAGTLGGDRALLLAFKANERQSRDRYRQASRAEHPAAVAAVLSRHAVDEVRHYSWALATLDDVGAGADTVIGVVERAVEIGSARMADVAERTEMVARRAGAAAGPGLRERVTQRPLESALIALGTGFLVSQLMRRDR